MKRPGLYFSILFVAIMGSTALVSTTISSICKSFYKNDTEKDVRVKTTPAENNNVKQASYKI
ncbi:MAG: hypothetical protein H7Y42_09800 [Chitinophagaceae bacterium]|nr:hypothetical protein [Chitinophagaceae bacterium]